MNPKHGPDGEGCCLTSKFGCCQDNISPAEVFWLRSSQRTRPFVESYPTGEKGPLLFSNLGARPGGLRGMRVHSVWLLPRRRHSCQRGGVRRLRMPGIHLFYLRLLNQFIRSIINSFYWRSGQTFMPGLHIYLSQSFPILRFSISVLQIQVNIKWISNKVWIMASLSQINERQQYLKTVLVIGEI